MKNTILSVLRHALTIASGLIVAKGYLTESTATELAGAVPGFVGLVWGAVDEYLAERKAKSTPAA